RRAASRKAPAAAASTARCSSDRSPRDDARGNGVLSRRFERGAATSARGSDATLTVGTAAEADVAGGAFPGARDDAALGAPALDEAGAAAVRGGRLDPAPLARCTTRTTLASASATRN